MYRPSRNVRTCENLSSVPHWGRLVHPKDGRKKVFCVLHAYFDDSGTHRGAQVCTLAGYFGSERQWNKFDRQWQKALQDAGLDEFHATRFWSHWKGQPIKEYATWGKERSKAFILQLLGIIGSYRIFPVGASVVMRDWESLSQDEKSVLTGATYDHKGKLVTSGAPNKTYFLPFLDCVHAAASYCNPGHLMHCSFDRNDYFSSYGLDYFNFLKSLGTETSKRLGEPFFPDSKRATPLQAADLLAYELNRYMHARMARGMGLLSINSILHRAAKNSRSKHDFKLYDQQGINLVLRDFREARAQN